MTHTALDGVVIGKQRISKKLEINVLPRSFEFPVGTMFWAKSKALSRLYNLNLSGMTCQKSH